MVFLFFKICYTKLADEDCMTTTSNYKEIRNNARTYYKSIYNIFCPALKNTILFQSAGFKHIIYKSHGNIRDKPSQVMRFQLLRHVTYLVKITTTIQEYEETIQRFHYYKKKVGKKVLFQKQVYYWGIIAIINNNKIKVILRKVGNGNIHFWSVIPAWITSKIRDKKFILTMKGNPKED